ncbi:class I SAM-dependent methyltransferase [Aliikangiella sp. G2MR2-5]|uniref:class I SAM-dependent methyltransferase n=1 Tax=Aliikangiella sp. G2MR2-5 TaxID=2788943 RepID=UPI001FF0026B|nr:class I SAM-dependent methyltransferase [Aliikangiella sp. G2MR2-5]
MKQIAPECPLCSKLTSESGNNAECDLYHQDKRRSYYQCARCMLVFVPACYHLCAVDEKAEYDKHQNNPDDPGYQRFLSRVTFPLFERVKLKEKESCSETISIIDCGSEAGVGSTKIRGLDFGCGPGPAISVMAEREHLRVDNYDLYYFSEPGLLQKQYDFITMTEVIEHLASPMMVLKQLDAMLKPEAILAIMTKRVTDQKAFSGWHYKNDPTHICYYSEATFAWIGQELGWRLEIIDKDVVFFHQQAD